MKSLISKFILKYRKPIIIILLLQYIKFFFLLVFAIDPSLQIVIPLGNTPYGVAWYILNFPYVLTLNEWIYKAYLLLVDTAILVFLWNRLDWKKMMFFQLFDLLWFEQGLANLTVLWTSVIGFIDPWFIIISFITKVPIGWLPPIDNPHVQYAIANANSGYYENIDHLKTYSFIIFWWLWPTASWIHKKWKGEDIYETKMSKMQED